MLKLPRLIYIELSNLGNERGGIHNQGLVGSQSCSVNSLDLGFRVYQGKETVKKCVAKHYPFQGLTEQLPNSPPIRNRQFARSIDLTCPWYMLELTDSMLRTRAKEFL
ncbi:hypothetical protein OIU78_027797 [Salix suchowensis]|nr:hypothetical protein OIU78_027797 [Salix suchowensis]